LFLSRLNPSFPFTQRGFAADAESRRAIVVGGALEALTLGAKNEDDVEIGRETACALCSLSLNEENKLDMAKEKGIIVDLVNLSQREDPMIARHAVSAMANIAENAKTHQVSSD
jgi:hypothetical protein